MATKSRKPSMPEPMEMLIEDHRKVQKMFKQFEKMKEQEDDHDDAQSDKSSHSRNLHVHYGCGW